MEQKTIFITGAASGIGKETALLFARQGWFVGIFDLNEEGLKELAKEIGEEKCCYGAMDVSSFDEFQKAVALFSEKTQERMDVLFNNAGIMRMGFFEEIPYENHIKTVQVNIIGIINGVYASMELLKKTPKSHIVSMCSASALYGVPELATYSASKFFVRGFTEALNIELEKHGIVVTDLMPLYVNTPMVSNQAHKIGSLDTFGVNLTPAKIASFVYKAAHGKKTHWVPTLKLKILELSGRLFPFLQKRSMKFFNRQ